MTTEQELREIFEDISTWQNRIIKFIDEELPRTQ
jgi:hypothetical protein